VVTVYASRPESVGSNPAGVQGFVNLYISILLLISLHICIDVGVQSYVHKIILFNTVANISIFNDVLCDVM
jgi:hypothetical protein